MFRHISFINYFVLAIAVALFVFLCDLQVDGGYAIPILYIIAIRLAYYDESISSLTIVGVLCTILTILGGALSPTNFSARFVVENRVFSITAIWVTTLLLRRVLILMKVERKRVEVAEKAAEQLEQAQGEDSRRRRAMASITEDLRLEKEKLIASEQRFRATVESAPTAMIMIDENGTIVLSNREALKLFGYEKSELVGSSIEVLVPQNYKKNHAHHRDQFLEEPTSRRMGAGRDLNAVRKDGSQFPVEIGLNPITTEEGAFVLSVIVDITERKKLEEAQRRTNENLEKRVEERTRELGLLAVALQQSNQELQQFAYVASHDLQTPLRSISNFSQFLKKEYEDQLDDTADDYINRIVNGCERMQTLINDLLEYSRVESNGKAFELIDLGEICDEAAELVNEYEESSLITVKRGALPKVMGDSRQLFQVFQNLIENALKYRSNDTPVIEVAAKAEGNHWIISMKDNGIGIDPEHHERIFDVFRRLHTHREYPGNGIGLAICRRIIKRHKGKIWLESQPGCGTTFFFSLPDQTTTD